MDTHGLSILAYILSHLAMEKSIIIYEADLTLSNRLIMAAAVLEEARQELERLQV